MLIGYGAKKDMVDMSGRTPLEIAIQFRHLKLAEILRGSGPAVLEKKIEEIHENRFKLLKARYEREKEYLSKQQMQVCDLYLQFWRDMNKNTVTIKQLRTLAQLAKQEREDTGRSISVLWMFGFHPGYTRDMIPYTILKDPTLSRKERLKELTGELKQWNAGRILPYYEKVLFADKRLLNDSIRLLENKLKNGEAIYRLSLVKAHIEKYRQTRGDELRDRKRLETALDLMKAGISEEESKSGKAKKVVRLFWAYADDYESLGDKTVREQFYQYFLREARQCRSEIGDEAGAFRDKYEKK